MSCEPRHHETVQRTDGSGGRSVTTVDPGPELPVSRLVDHIHTRYHGSLVDAARRDVIDTGQQRPVWLDGYGQGITDMAVALARAGWRPGEPQPDAPTSRGRHQSALPIHESVVQAASKKYIETDIHDPEWLHGFREGAEHITEMLVLHGWRRMLELTAAPPDGYLTAAG